MKRGRKLRDRAFLTVEHADGQAVAVRMISAVNGELAAFRLPAAKKKTALRFAIGEPGRRSTIWRVWPGHPKNDVYLASRKTAGIMKISLHESGDWRMQFINPSETGTVRWQSLSGDEPEGRILHRWRRPAAVEGWTRALSIWVPYEDLVEVPGEGEPWEDVQWLTPPPPGAAVEVVIYLVEAGAAALEHTSVVQAPDGMFTLINGFQLPGGEVVLAVAVTGELGHLGEPVSRLRAQAKTAAPEDFDRSPGLGPRHAVITVDEDGHRNLWDLAATEDGTA